MPRTDLLYILEQNKSNKSVTQHKCIPVLKGKGDLQAHVTY